jgi:hypothetical protein
MSSKPVVLRIVIVLLMLIIGGCDTTTVEPTTEQANPAPMATAVAPTPETAPTAIPLAEKSPTPVPEPASTQEIEDSHPGWESYANEAYQFTFRYPAARTLVEEPNLLKFSQWTLLFAVAFQRQGENVPLPWTGMPAGDFVSRGTILFLEQEIDKYALVYEGKVKALTYSAEADDLLLSIRLDDMAGIDYQTIEIPQSTQDEIDQIVSSFER